MSEQRIHKLRKDTNDTAFFTANVSDIFYLTGCTGSNNFLLVTSSEVVLFTDSRYITQIQNQSKVHLKIDDITKEFNIKKYNLLEVIINTEGLPFKVGKMLLDTIPNILYDIVNIRAFKDSQEIDILKNNINDTVTAFKEIKKILHKDMTEQQVAAELEYYCKSNGATDMSFKTIIISGEKTAMPHGKPSQRKLDDWIQFDFGIVKNGYCSDFSRVVSIGDVNPTLEEAHSIVRGAIDEVLSKARCGMTGQEIDLIARDFISKKGFLDEFQHGLGHGIGIANHEYPLLNAKNPSPILENSVCTIEPGLYFPSIGGVRLEDMAVMRSSGFELLTQCSYDYR